MAAASAMNRTIHSARRCPSSAAAPSVEPRWVRASERDASQTGTATGTASANPAVTSLSRRGSIATASTPPAASATQAPRLYVKYRVQTSTGSAAAASARPTTFRSDGREPERQQRPERRQQAEPVPVPDRRREPVPAEDVGRELAREQPRRERVGADPRECGEQAPKQQPDRLAPGEQEESGGGGHVQERALNLVDRLGRAGGPGERQCNPAGERAENPEQRQLGARERDVGREGQGESRRPGEPQRPPVPRAREVGALGSGERGRGDPQPDGGGQAAVPGQGHPAMTRCRCGRP